MVLSCRPPARAGDGFTSLVSIFGGSQASNAYMLSSGACRTAIFTTDGSSFRHVAARVPSGSVQQADTLAGAAGDTTLIRAVVGC